MLAQKTNIYKSKLIVIQYIASLELEHSESNTTLKTDTIYQFLTI